MGKLERLAKTRGVEVHQMVKATVDGTKNLYEAAILLDVAPTTLFMWLRRNGYKRMITREWKKQEAETA